MKIRLTKRQRENKTRETSYTERASEIVFKE